jgi:spermidine/putrescine transport system permease protein
VLPGVGWALAFFLAPLVLLTVYSFGTTDILTYRVRFGWTFENYTQIFDSVYVGTVLRSFRLSIGATLACLILGFPVAYAIASAPRRWQAVLLVAIMVPFWTSFVVRTYGLVNLLSDSGPLAGFLTAFGLADGDIRILFTPWSVWIGVVYAYLPLMILPLYVVLERIDSNLVGAAADLGASPVRTFRRVILPLAAPGIVAGCLLVGIPATGEYVVPAILGGEKTLMYGNVVADQFLKVGDYPFGSALAVSLMAIVVAVIVAGRRRSEGLERIA